MLRIGGKIKLFRPMLSRHYQVTVLGAAGEIGQTVSLLLRTQPLITKMVIHDCLKCTPGVSLDVSHVPTESTVTTFVGQDTLEAALKNSDVVIATGGALKKPSVTRKQWFESNMEFIRNVSVKIAKCTPMPIVGIATEPINSIVPMAAEIMRNNGNFDSRRLLGVTTIDVLRAQCLYAAENHIQPHDCFVPIIGGHSKDTIVPLLSQAQPQIPVQSDNYQRDFTEKMRTFDNAVELTKKGWSPILSTSYSILIFVRGVLEALNGRHSRVNAFVENNDFGTTYFSGVVTMNDSGYGEMQRYNNLSKFEVNLLESSIEQLRKDIVIGNRILEAA